MVLAKLCPDICEIEHKSWIFFNGGDRIMSILSKFANLKISIRLIFGFCVVIMLSASIGLCSIYTGLLTKNDFSTAVRRLENKSKVEKLDKFIYVGRMHVWAALESGQDEHWRESTDAIKRAKEQQVNILGSTKDSIRHANVEKLGKAIADYEVIRAHLQQIKASASNLEDAALVAALSDAGKTARAIDEATKELSASYEKDSDETVTIANKTIEDAIAADIILGLACAFFGIAIAFGVSRSITAPLSKLMATVQQLAQGNTGVVVPETDRKDEMGPLAKALEGWRIGLIEAVKRQEQERAEVVAREARQRNIDASTARFDTTINAMLSKIKGAVEHLHQSADALSANAEETQRQSSAVAAATDQATANVQTVSSASTELTASIQEISGQMQKSAVITNSAAEEAQLANRKIGGLAEAVQKIGEVVNLINDIASQTNLLALNATIESARAGEGACELNTQTIFII
jgi:methyl-accepting chemotaxis protein